MTTVLGLVLSALTERDLIGFTGGNMRYREDEESLRIGEALASCAEIVAHFRRHNSNPSRLISCIRAVRSL
jgi:hypothetical protein